MSDSLLSVSEARERLLAHFAPLGPEAISLSEAAGRVLAEDITSTLDLPPFANSAMDGYAVRAADVQSARPDQPVALPVVADIPAGGPLPEPLPPGSAARIMTGAPLPASADAVVPIELTNDRRPPANHAGTSPLTDDRQPQPSAVNGPPSVVGIMRPVQAGDHVRLAGEDLHAGELALPAGVLIRAQEIGMLAALGRPYVQVIRRPTVAVLSSGDELVEVDELLTPGKIRDVNGRTLAALIARYGAQVIHLGIARDTIREVTARLDRAVNSGADLIISSAGVSVGAFDYVKTAVETHGRLEFWRVNMRPGKPVAFGRYRAIPFLGLPGNPVSALVSFEVFARPALLRMGGRGPLEKPAVRARLLEPLASDGRESYLRAVVEREEEGYTARPAGGQGSAILSALVRANALVIVPAGVTSLAAGEVVTAWMLDWPEWVL